MRSSGSVFGRSSICASCIPVSSGIDSNSKQTVTFGNLRSLDMLVLTVFGRVEMPSTSSVTDCSYVPEGSWYKIN
eukprot:7524055-Karenia_brevis.AAC.1